MSDTGKYGYTEDDFNREFEKIKRSKLDKLTPSSRPSFYLFGGQAGAGKTKTVERFIKSNPGLYVVDVDELREQHPAYKQLQEEFGIDAAEYTHGFASRLKDRIVEYLRERGVSFGLETTMAHPDSVLNLVSKPEWKQGNYRVEAYGVAVAWELSEIGVVSRYLKGLETGNARYVPQEIRKEQYVGMPKTMHALAASGLMDTIGVYDRDGNELYKASGVDIDPVHTEKTVHEGRELENTPVRQLEKGLDSHENNQVTIEHMQATPATTTADQSERSQLTSDLKEEQIYAKQIEAALPVAREKEQTDSLPHQPQTSPPRRTMEERMRDRKTQATASNPQAVKEIENKQRNEPLERGLSR